MESLKPSIGTIVTAWFGAHQYTAVVVKHGRTAPHIRFTLKNGRVIQGRATIIPYGSPTGVTYKGYLAMMLPE